MVLVGMRDAQVIHRHGARTPISLDRHEGETMEDFERAWKVGEQLPFVFSVMQHHPAPLSSFVRSHHFGWFFVRVNVQVNPIVNQKCVLMVRPCPPLAPVLLMC
jgi:hypothetical protein